MTTIHLKPGETISLVTDPLPTQSNIDNLMQLHRAADGLLQYERTPLDPTCWTGWEDMYEASEGIIRDLVAAWPHTTPTLDEVRNGRKPIQGEPLPPAEHEMTMKPLRDALNDVVAKTYPGSTRREALVNDIIDLLRHRKNIRRQMRDQPPPPDEYVETVRHPQYTEPRTRRAVKANKLGDRSVRWTIMEHYVEGRSFDIDTADGWLREHGYHQNSTTPALSDLRQMGYLKKLRAAGWYKFVSPCASRHELKEMSRALKEMRAERKR